jgi:hypothetical protein
VPSYDAHLATTDQTPAYRYHKRFLQTLQERSESKRWLLKAPSHLFQLRTLFGVYPDARIVRTHRDPLKTLPSAINLLGTLKWMRCHEVDMSDAAKMMPGAYAYIYRKEIEQRARGVLPDAQFIDVQFDDIVRNPAASVEAVYRRLDWPFTDDVARGIAEYAARKPKGSRGEHHYSLEEAGLDAAAERRRFAFYTDHYGVRQEPA